MNQSPHRFLIVVIGLVLLGSLFCFHWFGSSSDPVITVVEAPTTQIATEPVATSHQAYMIAREYLKSVKSKGDHAIGDFNVRYDAKEQLWTVHVYYNPPRHGAFLTLYVSKKEAKVIRIEGGE